MIVVDSSVWIDHFNGCDSIESQQLMLLLDNTEPLIVPGIVRTEILLGLKTERDAQRISNLLSVFDLGPNWDDQDYLEAARIYRVCRRKGTTLRSTIDCRLSDSSDLLAPQLRVTE